MSVLEPTLLSLGRAGVIALATFAMLLIAGPGIRSTPRGLRAFFFWMAMAALLAPGFAGGYFRYENAMAMDRVRKEIFYCALVWLRFAWMAVLIVWLMPPALSREAMHCFRTSVSRPWLQRVQWGLRGWGRGLWIGVGMVFLLAFQEFELATTWNMRAWTVSLFDAQAGGTVLSESLRLVALPFAIQVAVLAVMVVFGRGSSPGQESGGVLKSRSTLVVLTVVIGAWLQCFPVASLFMGVPLAFVSRGAEAMGLAPWREIANGAGLAAASAAFAWMLAGWVESRGGWRRLLALPGLFGPMLCGLLLLALMRVPGLESMRDTVFAPVLGLVLLLLPFALLLRFGIDATRDHAAIHAARLAGARRAAWSMDGWPRLIAILLLFGFAYGDFTINSLLAPPQFTSASVRLLNLLHYGRNSSLNVMFSFAFAVPLLAALLTALAARFYARRRVC